MGYINDRIRLSLRGDVKISGRPLSELRELRTVELPEGLEKIGRYWF